MIAFTVPLGSAIGGFAIILLLVYFGAIFRTVADFFRTYFFWWSWSYFFIIIACMYVIKKFWLFIDRKHPGPPRPLIRTLLGMNRKLRVCPGKEWLPFSSADNLENLSILKEHFGRTPFKNEVDGLFFIEEKTLFFWHKIKLFFVSQAGAEEYIITGKESLNNPIKIKKKQKVVKNTITISSK